MPVEQASVVLVTDTSGSMNATDVEPSRLDAAKAAAERFLDRVPDELRVGLVAYSDAPHTVLRADRGPRRRSARRVDAADAPTAAPRPATRSTARCARSATRGEDSPPAAIVLLSDGATQSGRDPAEVAREAARGRRADLHGRARHGRRPGRGRRPASSPSRPTPRRCAEVAQLSGGAAFAAEDADALDEVYERLGSQIGTREEKREISAGLRRRRPAAARRRARRVAALARAPAVGATVPAAQVAAGTGGCS